MAHKPTIRRVYCTRQQAYATDYITARDKDLEFYESEEHAMVAAQGRGYSKKDADVIPVSVIMVDGLPYVLARSEPIKLELHFKEHANRVQEIALNKLSAAERTSLRY